MIMAKITVKSVIKGEPPCPSAPPKPGPRPSLVPTDPPRRFPPPPPFFFPGPCCPGTTQVVDNVTVLSLTPETLIVQEGTYQGMKAFGLATEGMTDFDGTKHGLVPAPKEGDEGKVLSSSGEWCDIELPDVPGLHIPEFPTEDGDYILKCRVTYGQPTLFWTKDLHE